MDGIRIEALCKSYTDRRKKKFQVLNDINFNLNPGEFVSLIGESGSGKSTLARIILGLDPPTSGQVTLDGTVIDQIAKNSTKLIYKKIQAVFQDASGTLNPKLSVYHNVEESLVNLTKLNRHARKERIFELVSLLDMKKELLRSSPRQLSGGEQRRMSLLRAMTIQPKYLILDEVVSGLDSISKNSVEALLMNYKKKYNCGILYITHDKSSAYRLSDRIALIDNGKLIQEGKMCEACEMNHAAMS